MAVQNDRAAIQIAALDLQKVNDAFRRVSQQITLLEGRSGSVAVRDSMTITSDKQTLVDFDSTTAGKGSIVAFGAENATLALAKGSRKEDNGEWIATDTSSTIFALDRSGNGTLYYNSGLTVGQAFNPTSIYVIGSGGSVGAHTLTGGSSPHTESGLTPGYLLTATGATTFGWAASSSARRLTTNTTPVTTSSGTLQDLMTYTLPGGTLASDGSYIHVVVAGTLAADADSKVVTINFGAYSATFVSGTLNNLDWLMEMWVYRTGATSQVIVSKGGWNGVMVYCDTGSAAETLANNITIKCTGDGTNASDITQSLLSVEFFP